MNWGTQIFGITLITLLAPEQPTAESNETKFVEVRLLAHHWPTAISGLTFSGLRNLFIARVEMGAGEMAEGEIVLLDYLHNNSKPPQIDQLLSWDGIWSIPLSRNRNCDAEISDLITISPIDNDTGEILPPEPALQLLPGGLGVSIPRKGKLPCYTFGPEKFFRGRNKNDG